MGRLRSCRCQPISCRPKVRENGKGEQIAVACNRCMRFVSQRLVKLCRRGARGPVDRNAIEEARRIDRDLEERRQRRVRR